MTRPRVFHVHPTGKGNRCSARPELHPIWRSIEELQSVRTHGRDFRFPPEELLLDCACLISSAVTATGINRALTELGPRRHCARRPMMGHTFSDSGEAYAIVHGLIK